jgi:hypothetical protein
MKKEKVIIFEGEQNFVIPKNRVRDKKTGVSYYVPNDVNADGKDKSIIVPKDEEVVDPGGGGGGGEPVAPIEPIMPKEPDAPIEPDDPTKRFPTAGEEVVTPSTPLAITTPVLPLLPIDMGVAPSKMVGGGGGGGGGSKQPSEATKKTFLQKYWWLLLLVAAGGGYYYYKKKNK